MATKKMLEDRRAKRKERMPGKVYVYVKVFKGSFDAAHVFLCHKPWNEMLSTLSDNSSASDFFSSARSAKTGIIAAGRLRLESIYFEPIKGRREVYSPTYTRVGSRYKKCGFGILLYKVMLLAAKEHARRRRKRRIFFAADAAVHGSTSSSAWRCYTSLARKGYILNVSNKENPNDHRKYDHFKIVRFPKNIKPTFIKAA